MWGIFLVMVLCLLCIMGGKRNRLEPITCDYIKSNANILRFSMKGGLNPYLEHLHGSNLKPSKIFFNG